MLFETFRSYLLGHPVVMYATVAVAVLVIDFVVTVIAGWVVDYFCGSADASTVTQIVGWPLFKLGEGCYLVWQGLSYPWRFRQRRLLCELVGLDVRKLNDKHEVENDRKIYDSLHELAVVLHNAYDQQERDRQHNLAPHVATSTLDVAEKKDAFWEAFGAAEKLGFRQSHRQTSEFLRPTFW